MRRSLISLYWAVVVVFMMTASDSVAARTRPAEEEVMSSFSKWSPANSGTSSALQGVWGSGPADVWAVGLKGAILHNNGTSWSSATSGTSNDLYGVWGSGPADIWAVGNSGTVVRNTGASFASVTGSTTYPINGVWGGGPSDVWAVGNNGAILHLQ